MAKQKAVSGDKNEQQTALYFFDSRRNEVRLSPKQGEFNCIKAVLRSIDTKWYEQFNDLKGTPRRKAILAHAEKLNVSSMMGEFTSLTVASQKKNLGSNVTKETKTKTKKATPKASAVDEQPTIADLMAMIAALQTQQD
tara:strand:- start:1481 stop:1897 length:417 start_codon:yes stop_codon:yes gene_type:complete